MVVVVAVGSPCEYGSHAAAEPLWGVEPNDRGVDAGGGAELAGYVLEMPHS